MDKLFQIAFLIFSKSRQRQIPHIFTKAGFHQFPVHRQLLIERSVLTNEQQLFHDGGSVGLFHCVIEQVGGRACDAPSWPISR